MSRTNLLALAAAAAFCALATLIITWRFYGSLTAVPASGGALMWCLAVVCVIIALRVRDRKKDNRIGLDRSQLNPLRVAQFLVIGKASAWTGAIIGGAYIGMACYVLPMAAKLSAAADDTPTVIFAALGGVALSAAGVWLERTCEVPPPTDAELVG